MLATCQTQPRGLSRRALPRNGRIRGGSCRKLGACIVVISAVFTVEASASSKTKPVQFGLHLQGRGLYEKETSVPTPSFQARRVRIDGAWKQKSWRAALKLALEEGKSRLLNANVSWAPDRRLNVRFGQFKKITNLDYVVGSYAQRIYERSIIGNQVDSNRDIGVQARSRWLDGAVDLRVAVLNGNGANTTGNDGEDLRYEGRLDVHIGKNVKYEKQRIGRRPRLMLGAAAGTRAIDDPTKNAKGTQLWSRTRRTTLSAAVVAQVWRHELRAEWVERSTVATDPITGPEAPDPAAVEVVRDGGYAQWAWTLPTRIPLETSARAQLYRPLSGIGERRVQYDAGLTWQVIERGGKLSLHGWTRQVTTTAEVKPRSFGLLAQFQLQM